MKRCLLESSFLRHYCYRSCVDQLEFFSTTKFKLLIDLSDVRISCRNWRRQQATGAATSNEATKHETETKVSYTTCTCTAIDSKTENMSSSRKRDRWDSSSDEEEIPKPQAKNDEIKTDEKADSAASSTLRLHNPLLSGCRSVYDSYERIARLDEGTYGGKTDSKKRSFYIDLNFSSSLLQLTCFSQWSGRQKIQVSLINDPSVLLSR
jgi:hypothetical protein